MHFRERSQTVQLIRTSYDASTKKSKSEIVGRLSKANPKVTDALNAALTAAERKELTAWLAGRATVEKLKRELAVRSLPEQLALAEEWFANQKSDEAKLLAANLVPAWGRLRVTMKRGGLVD